MLVICSALSGELSFSFILLHVKQSLSSEWDSDKELLSVFDDILELQIQHLDMILPSFTLKYRIP